MADKQPITLVIFGASGDLASRKLLPALYWLEASGELTAQLSVIGVARSPITSDSLVGNLAENVKQPDKKVLERLRKRIDVVRMDSKDPKAYGQLLQAFERQEAGKKGAVRILHLSIPPLVALPIIDAMREVGLSQAQDVTTRLLLEKPFGSDLNSAEELEAHLSKSFKEEQIYRIDHYMAKETAQNICLFRFNNPVIRPLWCREHIESIQITATEPFGIEGRADFYEQTGALRDIIQSHLLGLMSLVMMELPISVGTSEFHRSRLEILESIVPIEQGQLAKRARRGQYAGYKEEVQNRDSATETFAALRLQVQNQRWKGVPVTLVTGKAVGQVKTTELRIQFRKDSQATASNQLVFRLQPDEGMELLLAAKKPGLTAEVEPMFLKYKYPLMEQGRLPDGYERVFADAMAGDQTNFMTGPEVLATWRLLDPVLKAWSQDRSDLEVYAAHSAGPKLWD